MALSIRHHHDLKQIDHRIRDLADAMLALSNAVAVIADHLELVSSKFDEERDRADALAESARLQLTDQCP